MKILINKLDITFKDKRPYFFIVLIMFCIGISFGVYTVKYMGDIDKSDLTNYFLSFTNSVTNDPINYSNLLLNVIRKNLFIIIPILMFAFTFFGAPFILILDLVKGFSLGYTFSFIATTYQGKGFGLALSALIPQNLIYIPCIIFLSVVGLVISTDRFKRKFFKIFKGNDPFLDNLGTRIMVIILLFTFGILIETYVSPGIIKFVAKRFYS